MTFRSLWQLPVVQLSTMRKLFDAQVKVNQYHWNIFALRRVSTTTYPTDSSFVEGVPACSIRQPESAYETLTLIQWDGGPNFYPPEMNENFYICMTCLEWRKKHFALVGTELFKKGFRL